MTNPRFVEQGISVWDLDDGYAFYAATDFKSAMAHALEDWGYTGEAAREARQAACSAKVDLDANTVNLSDEGDEPEIITFREEIKRLLATGVEFPRFLCGMES